MILQTYDTECSNGPVGARKPILNRAEGLCALASQKFLSLRAPG